MKISHSSFTALCLLIAGAVGDLSAQQPRDLTARDDARKIAIKFRARGYEIDRPPEGVETGSMTLYQLRLDRGTDCVLMVGVSGGMEVDLYVKDHVGNVVAQDTRSMARACLAFTASYDGDYEVFVKPAERRNPLGHFALLVATKVPGKPDSFVR